MADQLEKIGIIVPDPLLGKLFEELAPDSPVNFEIRSGFMEDGVREAKELVAAGVHILISRGETCRLIREANLDAFILEIPITIQDVLSLVSNACAVSSTIALVGFGEVYHAARSLAPILPVSLKIFRLSAAEDIDCVVQQIIASGIRVIAGTPLVVAKCISQGLTGFALQTRKAAALRILESAARISEIQANARRFNLGREVTSKVLGGETFLLDKNGNLMQEEAQARNSVSPDLDAKIIYALRNGFPYEGKLLINSTEVHCSLHPIINNGKNYGGLLVVESGDEGKTPSREQNEKFPAKYNFENIIHSSENMAKCVRQAKLYARHDEVICLRGESGSGKEMFAHAIHNASPRFKQPFIAINCGAIPETLLASELFGYGRGAFTGARQSGRTGLFELANGGTIFLDEINEASPHFQIHLLRFLEEGQFFRIGEEQPVKVDVRVICATNSSLEELVRQNRFRRDLYYRIQVLPIFIPPLRKRNGCLERLTDYFLCEASGSDRFGTEQITAGARRLLHEWHFPGNVRELRNLVRRLVILSEKGPIDATLVQTCLAEHKLMDRAVADVKSLELRHIQDTLESCAGNRESAARKLGISKTTLWRRLKLISDPRLTE